MQIFRDHTEVGGNTNVGVVSVMQINSLLLSAHAYFHNSKSQVQKTFRLQGTASSVSAVRIFCLSIKHNLLSKIYDKSFNLCNI